MMSFHFIVHFEPLPGKEAAFREELLRVNGPSRAEKGCLRIDVFESVRELINHSKLPRHSSVSLSQPCGRFRICPIIDGMKHSHTCEKRVTHRGRMLLKIFDRRLYNFIEIAN